MLRATLFGLALLPASAFKFVSQTFKGEYTDESSNPHTVEFGLDMESVKFRSNHHVVGQIGKTNMSFDSKMSVIFDVEAKRVTTWNEVQIAAASPSPAPGWCMYSEFPSLPAPAIVAKCLQNFVSDAEPTTSEDGLQKFQIPILRKFPYSAEIFVQPRDVLLIVRAAISTDDSFVMKKIIADLSQPDAHAMPLHAEMTDMDSKAGAPDSSMFVVPTEWGTCDKINPVLLGINDINPVMRAFTNCMELGASQAPIVV